MYLSSDSINNSMTGFVSFINKLIGSNVVFEKVKFGEACDEAFEKINNCLDDLTKTIKNLPIKLKKKD